MNVLFALTKNLQRFLLLVERNNSLLVEANNNNELIIFFRNKRLYTLIAGPVFYVYFTFQ